jgi:MFS family permease
MITQRFTFSSTWASSSTWRMAQGNAITVEPTKRSSPFSSLRVPVFRWWFTSQVLSASGSMTQGVGAAWLVLQLTGRGVDLAVLTTASLLPVLFGGAWAGALVDRVDRRRLLIFTQSTFTVLSAVLFVLTVEGDATFASILVISALNGSVGAVDGPCRQVYVLELVGRDRLVSAVSLYEVVLNASRVIGPGLGGALLVLSGPAACFLANSLSFLPPLLVLLWYSPTKLSGTSGPRAALAVKEREPGAVRAGLRYALSVPEIRACLLLAAASGVLFNPGVLFPLLASRAFGIGGGGYGGLVAAFGVGALPGALLAARSRGEPKGSRVVLLAELTAASMVLTALAPDVVLGLVGMALSGLASIWFIASANALVQLRALPTMRGRVMGVWTMALPGMNPVTAVLAGSLADWAGIRVAYAAAGALVLVAALTGRSALHNIAAR